jgi:hypothetical protein
MLLKTTSATLVTGYKLDDGLSIPVELFSPQLKPKRFADHLASYTKGKGKIIPVLN